MALQLHQIYEELQSVPMAGNQQRLYAVAPVREYAGYFVGRDHDGTACVLVEAGAEDGRPRAPIRLENLHVQFGVQCVVRGKGEEREGRFTVVQCRALQRELVHYFFSVAETIIRALGIGPTEVAVGSAVGHLARIFQKLQSPATQSVAGLFGELLLIRQSRRPADLLNAWRLTDTSRFDFSAGDVRLDVKTTTGRTRAHLFSYEQCNPSPGTVALVASLFLEQSPTGTSLQDMVTEVERAVLFGADLVMKLHETISGSLGSGLLEGLSMRFDARLASSTMQFFDLRAIPGIRGDLPVGVSDVHFRSDLTAQTPISLARLAQAHPGIAHALELLPSTASEGSALA